MKQLIFIFLLLLIYCQRALAQKFSDSFNSGNLAAWVFQGTDFIIDNGQLRSNRSTGSSEVFDIAALYNPVTAEVWSFYCSMGFNPSSQNYTEFCIASDTLPEYINNGYVLRMGNTTDNLVLYKVTSGISTALITGPTGALNKSINNIYVQVKRDVNQNWILYYKEKQTDTFTLVGLSNDPAFNGGKYTGIKIVQTASNAKKHVFDDIYIGKEVKDTLAPKMKMVQVIFPDSLIVSFDEPVKFNTPGIFEINSVTPIYIGKTANPDQLGLKFPFTFSSGTIYNLENSGTSDLLNNISNKHILSFSAYKIDTPQKNDLIFTEVMAQPDPSQGILPPTAEYIELYNRSSKYLRLSGLKFSDAATSVSFPDSVIPPYSFFSVSRSTFGTFSGFGKWVGLSTFPSLNNDEDHLKITSPYGETICYVNYKSSWHKDAIKAKGGWSLELADTSLFCVEEGNWTSNMAGGGTPGKTNSVASPLTLIIAPFVKQAFVISPNTIKVILNQSVDSISASNLSNYSIHKGGIIQPVKVGNWATDKTAFNLVFGSAVFAPNEILKLEISGLRTCYGRHFPLATKSVGMFDTGFKNQELVINELLFDPKNHDDDYLELYNCGSRIINVSNVLLCRKDENGNIVQVYEISSEAIPLLPEQYLLITTGINNILNQYPVRDENAMWEIADMPTLANDKGNVLITNRQGRILDYFEYKASMHFEIIQNAEGVALERVNPGVTTSLNANWNSATQASGFGTPGLKNSVFQTGNQNNKTKNFWFSVPYCSPDNDGLEDQLILNYELDDPSYSVTLRVFDSDGNYICAPMNNTILNRTGEWVVSLNCNQRILRQGNYIAVIECWNKNGKRLNQKLTFSILGR